VAKENKSFFKKTLRFLLKIFIWFLILSNLSVIIYRWVDVPVTPLMLIRSVQQKMNGKEMRADKSWVNLEKISPHLQLAVVCSEDQKFLEHYGVDFDALKKAMLDNETNKKAGKKKFRGGSTITMQTAKNVFLWPGRDYVRKGLELYFSLLIELYWSKERIMEVYLNVIEFGDGVYGAEQACRVYFGKTAEEITKVEAATLSPLLPNPREYGKNINGEYIQKRKLWVLKQMKFYGGKLEYDTSNPKENKSQKK
jgi:monofunctional biosynthetic peptidoglycan transglycosylase